MNGPGIDTLLPRLEGVRQSAPGRWTSRCPAHEDRSPSLSISDVDGKILIHCHAGCSFEDVIAAVGMSASDFFPPTRENGRPIPKSQRWVPRQVLDAIAAEALVVVVAAETIAAGRTLSDVDIVRLIAAAERIRTAVHT